MVCVCTFEAVTSSRLYGLTLVKKKTFTCGSRHAGACCGLCSSVRDSKCGVMWYLWGWAGGDVFHTDNCMILCSERCKVSVVATLGVEVLGGSFRSRGKGPEWVVCTCSAVGTGYRCLCSGRGRVQAYKQLQGPRPISEARANCGQISVWKVPGCLVCPCRTAEASQRYMHDSRVQCKESGPLVCRYISAGG